MEDEQWSEEDWEQFYEETFAFTKAVGEAFKAGGGKRGVTYQFICPLCGGEAWVMAMKINGHKHAKCSKCGVGLMQ